MILRANKCTRLSFNSTCDLKWGWRSSGDRDSWCSDLWEKVFLQRHIIKLHLKSCIKICHTGSRFNDVSVTRELTVILNVITKINNQVPWESCIVLEILQIKTFRATYWQSKVCSIQTVRSMNFISMLLLNCAGYSNRTYDMEHTFPTMQCPEI